MISAESRSLQLHKRSSTTHHWSISKNEMDDTEVGIIVHYIFGDKESSCWRDGYQDTSQIPRLSERRRRRRSRRRRGTMAAATLMFDKNEYRSSRQSHDIAAKSSYHRQVKLASLFYTC